jgi:hypothetical protein
MKKSDCPFVAVSEDQKLKICGRTMEEAQENFKKEAIKPEK